jgi:dipeptidyl aminopeptidase/acylaminoacyl peptidase
MRFSPDDRQLVCVYYLQIYIVDISTGSLSLLIYHDDGVMMPDWSPDGSRIVYISRNRVLHSYELASGLTQQIRPDPWVTTDTVYVGTSPLWSRDGTQIAFVQEKYEGDNIVLINPDGSGYQVLAAAQPDDNFGWFEWYHRPTRAVEGIVYYQLNHPDAGPYFVSRAGPPIIPFHYTLFPLSPQQSFAPDGEWVVTVGTDPADSVSVLFVHRTEDITGSSRRQLTFWDPPAAVESAQDE